MAQVVPLSAELEALECADNMELDMVEFGVKRNRI